MGANCDNKDLNSIAYLIDLCNDFGMDTIECGNILAVAMEASQRGLISDRISWGDPEVMVELVRKIALREGIGDVLTEGCLRAAKAFGDESLAMHVKGQGIPAYDPRGIKGIGLGYATSNRGACHLRAYTPASEIMGIPSQTDRLAWKGKGELVKAFQDLHAVSDSLNICKFSAFAQNAQNYAAQYSAMTGVEVDVDELLKIGEKDL